MLSKEINLTLIIDGCRRQNRNSQRKLYEHFYGYGMNICLRYTRRREEATEMLNDAFLKIMNNLDKYDSAYPFKGWFRRILINTAIDHYRRNQKYPIHQDLATIGEVKAAEAPMPQLSPNEDVLPLLRQLSPSYRMVFSLYVLEGYQHHEIAEMLNISSSSSRSNLVRAKEKLREILNERQYKSVKTN